LRASNSGIRVKFASDLPGDGLPIKPIILANSLFFNVYYTSLCVGLFSYVTSCMRRRAYFDTEIAIDAIFWPDSPHFSSKSHRTDDFCYFPTVKRDVYPSRCASFRKSRDVYPSRDKNRH